MTAGSSDDDGFGQQGSRRAPLAHPLTRLRRESTTGAKHGVGSADRELDSKLAPLELELEPELEPVTSLTAQAAVDPPPTLAPETPLPRCLTDAAYASSRPAPAAIPPAPKLPRFSVPAAASSAAIVAASSADAGGEPSAEQERAPDSQECLGLPTDRVLPGSPALVSTFRPKPQMRSGYSVTHNCQEERIYPKRGRKAKPPAKRRR